MSQTSQGRTLLVTGRIVWVNGDLFQGEVKKDQNTRQPIMDNVTGKPKIEYGFGLAVPKDQLQLVIPPNQESLWGALYKEAYSIYPSGHIPPGFAWKYKDGDGVDHNGRPYSEREGYAGHLILSLSTSIPLKFFKWEPSMNTNVQINEGIKCGDYVTAQVGIKAHPAMGQGKPGLYLNPYAVQLVGYGKEIIRTPSADSIFGGAAPVAPMGASQTPVANMGSFPTQAVGPAPVAPQQPAAPAIPTQFAQPTAQVPQGNYAGIPAHLNPQAAQPAAPAIPGLTAPVGQPTSAPSIPGMPAIPGLPR